MRIWITLLSPSKITYRWAVSEDEAMLEEISRQLKIPRGIVKQAADDYVSSIKVFAVKS